MAKYRKKPVVVEALQWTGNNTKEVLSFAWPYVEYRERYKDLLVCLEAGELCVEPGDYIVKGIDDKFYPCKPDIFAATYELVQE